MKRITGDEKVKIMLSCTISILTLIALSCEVPQKTWMVSTIAGDGRPGYQDDFAKSAQFRYPTGVAVDASGNIYVADRGNNRIKC